MIHVLKRWKETKKRICIVVTLLLTFAPGVSMGDTQELSTEEEIKAFEAMFPEEELTEADVYRTDRLLVTATGSQIPVYKAPSVASVTTAEDIEKMGATSLDEILETVPGLHVIPSGLNTFSSIWSIRGLHTTINPQVLLLVNGIQLSQITNGGRPQTFRMPVAMISRVEVVRGPGSAVHGADAYTGVVNVITKDNFEIDGTEVGGRYGSFETSDIWLQHGGEYGAWDVWAGIEWQQSKGDHDRIVTEDYIHALGAPALSNAPGHLDTRYEVIDAHAGLRRGNLTAQFHGNWLRDNAMGPGALQALAYENQVNGHGLMGDIEYRDRKFTPELDLALRLYAFLYSGDNYFQLLPASFLNMIGNPGADHKYAGAELTGLYSFLTNHNLRLSTGFRFIDTTTHSKQNFGPGVPVQYGELVNVEDTPYIFMDDQNRNFWFVSAQDEWALARHWDFTAGIRYDNYSDFGGTFNPRAALVWEARHDLTAKLLYGRAFRAPAFNEMYQKNNPVVRGNPDLDPETIDTYELALDYQPTARFRTILSIFNYQAKDMIDFIGALPAPAVNSDEIESTGFELEFEWKPVEELTLKGNYSFQRAKNKLTDSPVADTPRSQFYFNPHWEFASDWSIDGQYYYVGGRKREQGDPRDDIDDYQLVNLTLRHKNIVDHWDVALAVRNVFDEDIREPSLYNPAAPKGAYIPGDYPMEGRALWAELSFHF